MKALENAYPRAEKIRVVQDNLDTQNTSSFYEHFSAGEVFVLSQHFDFYHTPKSASWLNMIEIEFSAFVKQCFERRIPRKRSVVKKCWVLSKKETKSKSNSTGSSPFKK